MRPPRSPLPAGGPPQSAPLSPAPPPVTTGAPGLAGAAFPGSWPPVASGGGSGGSDRGGGTATAGGGGGGGGTGGGGVGRESARRTIHLRAFTGTPVMSVTPFSGYTGNGFGGDGGARGLGAGGFGGSEAGSGGERVGGAGGEWAGGAGSEPGLSAAPPAQHMMRATSAGPGARLAAGPVRATLGRCPSAPGSPGDLRVAQEACPCLCLLPSQDADNISSRARTSLLSCAPRGCWYAGTCKQPRAAGRWLSPGAAPGCCRLANDVCAADSVCCGVV